MKHSIQESVAPIRHRDDQAIGYEEYFATSVKPENWVNIIQQALENDQFCLYTQEIRPAVNPTPGDSHQEILVRTRDPTFRHPTITD
ncbi:MAG TPA: hypothetical protein EYN73_09450 [Chromatiaceae bacterium]|nr:hypothetical protein [Chromatiaceae bacterium]HIA09270.1 hypothetical protein [Chromatiaceae bacterium]HIN83166.1 hypothetical protein [Chromatiales bacterium]